MLLYSSLTMTCNICGKPMVCNVRPFQAIVLCLMRHEMVVHLWLLWAILDALP